MVFKFLSKGKKSEYFLEAPSENGSSPETKIAEAKQAVEETLVDAKQAADAQVDKLKATVAKIADTVEDKVADTAAPKKTKKLKQVKSDAKSDAKPEASAAAKPVAAAPAKAAPQPSSASFASDFLMPSSTPRRRPGPSMDMFRNMAKDVTPRK